MLAKRKKKNEQLPSFRDIIEMWDMIKTFGDDIGVKPVTARKMYARNSISIDHWDAVVDAAKMRRYKTTRGESVTVDLLARIAAARRRRLARHPSQRALSRAA